MNAVANDDLLALYDAALPPPVAPERTAALFRGLGRGVRRQAQDFVSALRSPRKAAEAAVEGVKAAARDPLGTGKAMLQSEALRAREAVEDPVAAGEYLASYLNPARLLQRAPDVREITTYHGSPHVFDEFDASKIGTGEGLQAYGHGLYLAQSPEVARQYSKAGLADGYWHFDKKGNVANKDGVVFKPGTAGYDRYKDVAKEAAEARGNLYTVDLPDEMVEQMLDYNAPLSKQPQRIREFFEPYVKQTREMLAQPGDDKWGDLAAPTEYDPTGLELLTILGKQNDLTPEYVLSGGTGGARTAEVLRQQGIPGIRYLDAGSRGNGSMFRKFADKADAEAFAANVRNYGGDGIVQPRPDGWVVVGEPPRTRNFVVFPGEEKKLRILRRE